MSLFALFLITALVVYAGLCIYLYLNQRALLYFPTPLAESVHGKRISINSGDHTLQLRHAGPSSERAIIYFGGNAEDVSASLPRFAAHFPAHALYFVHYRGYGGSSGAPSEDALFADALAVYDFVRKQHRDITVVGRSLGSGVATYLASARKVQKLVLITPYDSIVNVAQQHYAWFPVSWLLKDKFESHRHVQKVRAPIFVAVAEHDELIPRARSDALIKAMQDKRPTVLLLPGTTHNSIDEPPLYWQRLREFLQ